MTPREKRALCPICGRNRVHPRAWCLPCIKSQPRKGETPPSDIEVAYAEWAAKRARAAAKRGKR